MMETQEKKGYLHVMPVKMRHDQHGPRRLVAEGSSRQHAPDRQRDVHEGQGRAGTRTQP